MYINAHDGLIMCIKMKYYGSLPILHMLVILVHNFMTICNPVVGYFITNMHTYVNFRKRNNILLTKSRISKNVTYI